LKKELILKRLNEIVEELKEESADISKLDEEYRSLETALNAARLQENALELIQKGGETRTIDAIETEGSEKGQAEKRGRDLVEKRTVTVGASSIILPKYSSSAVTSAFNEVSALIDRVSTVELVGGEAYSQPYIKNYGAGDYTNEGANYAEAEPVFGYAEIGKTKITAYAEDTEEIRKLPAANYDAIVRGGITKALRKKITREIMVGDGASGHFTGIFCNPSDAAKRVIDPATDIEIAAINENTLDQIVFTYGGSEEVEDAAVLILNKLDLYAFAKVKGTDKKRAYEIKLMGGAGVINGIPYIINSACKAISDTPEVTTPAEYCMAYGSLSNYQKVIFSNVDIQFSTDYKFKQGNIAHRGSVFIGGNVVAYNGFLRVKRPAITIG
jgi:HK97 family phage major capsid protein